MMKRPFHAWLLYAICLAFIVPAMIWMSHKILQVERARENSHRETELARQSAELQERITSALWRMDGMLMPLVAQEASRPHYVYDAFYSPIEQLPIRDAAIALGQSKAPRSKSAKPKGSRETEAAKLLGLPKTPSPLLFRPSKYVILNFEAQPDGDINSPQVPLVPEQQRLANDIGYSSEMLSSNEVCLIEVQNFFNFEQVLEVCPTIRLPNAVPRQADPKRAEPLDQLAYGQSYNRFNGLVESQRQTASGHPSEQLQQRQVREAPQTQSNAAQQANAEPQIAEPMRQQASQQPSQSSQQSRGSFGNVADWQRAKNTARGNSEFAKRSQTINNQSLNLWSQNRRLPNTKAFVNEGVMTAVWLDNNLVLARRANRNQQEVIQCCWLDWELIKNELATEVADLLPEFEFEPIRKDAEAKPELALAALPAQLVLDESQLSMMLDDGYTPPPASGLKLGLLLAWISLGVAAIASAILLNGVLRLNERRAAFVSAVTHELRTPLTTFRMYAEMLAEKMVPPEKQQSYANTLKIESDRLAHLVENVLQFARLERGAKDDLRETLTIGEIFDRFQGRLLERAKQADMDIVLDLSSDLLQQQIETTPSALEQVIFNLVDNACKYARDAKDRRIEISGARRGREYHFSVRDFGPGVDAGKRHQLFKAFRKSDQDSADTAQGVGLGLALCRRIAKRLGGSLQLTEKSPGAEFVLRIPTN